MISTDIVIDLKECYDSLFLNYFLYWNLNFDFQYGLFFFSLFIYHTMKRFVCTIKALIREISVIWLQNNLCEFATREHKTYKVILCSKTNLSIIIGILKNVKRIKANYINFYKSTICLDISRVSKDGGEVAFSFL